MRHVWWLGCAHERDGRQRVRSDKNIMRRLPMPMPPGELERARAQKMPWSNRSRH